MDLFHTYLEYVKPFRGSTRYHTWSVLSGISALLERRCWLPIGGLGEIYPNQFIVLCGGPGTGKSTASRTMCEFIKQYNKALGANKGGLLFGPDKTTPAALFKRMKSAQKTIKTAEFSHEQSAIYLHSTELSTMIKDIGGGSLSDDFLKFYDCDDYFEKELAGEGIIRVVGPCLNLLADTTPSFLSGFLPKEESGSGLTARMIFATELGEVEMDEVVPDGDKNMQQEILRHIARIHRMAGMFRIDPLAVAFWKEWYFAYRKVLFNLQEGSYMRYFYARKPTHIRKVAMALSAARDSNRILTLADYQKAIEVIEEAEPYMDKSFGVKDFRHVTDGTKQILDCISIAPREIKRSALIMSLYRSGVSGQLDEFDGLIKILIEGKLINKRTEKTEVFYSRNV